ncbi:MAG: polysaccharide deacetylase family protein [Planctomycetales bacterium]|nr:polysaccharide deacetylase family protein [Planctomycetales bacterium]
MLRLESGEALVSGELTGQHRLKVVVEPEAEAKSKEPVVVRVELPMSGRAAWPAADVEVRDSQGRAVVVRRGGLEWHKLLIPVPSSPSTYTVQVVPPSKSMASLRPTREEERRFADAGTGIRGSIAHWHDGRRAALSLRFDDSHPTHLSKAIPILREYGFRGTFMVNPGPDEPGSRRRSPFQAELAAWKAVAEAGDQEFANHTAHHRGATSDEGMDVEIGSAARVIRELTPGRSPLMALNLGGGTVWSTSHTLRHYLERHRQFDASSGSLGMDDSYGNRVSAFRAHLERHLTSGGWCRAHFHYIGKGLSSSEANFRAALDVAKQHREALWIAGMADIHKYQLERNSSALKLLESDDDRIAFRLECSADAELYDQPLTIEMAGSPAWPADQLRLQDARGAAIAVRKVSTDGGVVLRAELAARSASYFVVRSPAKTNGSDE